MEIQEAKESLERLQRAQSGNESTMRRLVNEQDKYGHTALHTAVLRDQTKVAQWLIEKVRSCSSHDEHISLFFLAVTVKLFRRKIVLIALCLSVW